MRYIKTVLKAGLVGAVAIAAIPAAQASTTYGLTIVQGSCDGATTGCSALSTNPTFTPGTVIGTGTWTSTLANGGLNFSLPTGGTDTIGAFLATGTGSYSGTGTGSFGNVLSTSGPGTQTEFIFTGTLPTPSSITITHDDGFAFYLAGALNPASQPNPTIAETVTFTSAAGAAQLNYVASNGLPEVLNFAVTPIPLPASVWLFGAALGGLGLLSRRRRKGPLALAA